MVVASLRRRQTYAVVCLNARKSLKSASNRNINTHGYWSGRSHRNERLGRDRPLHRHGGGSSRVGARLSTGNVAVVLLTSTLSSWVHAAEGELRTELICVAGLGRDNDERDRDDEQNSCSSKTMSGWTDCCGFVCVQVILRKLQKSKSSHSQVHTRAPFSKHLFLTI